MDGWMVWIVALVWFIFGWNLRGLRQKFRDLRTLRQEISKYER
jgi:hypothetical protein